MSDSSSKGKFLEELTGLLYDVGGSNVELDVQLPSIDGTGRTRQIDVLVSFQSDIFGNCPVRLPIECKNYGKPIEIHQIDAFFGMLHDVGIDPHLGIFVAASEYRSGAVERAALAGINALIAKGLTADRLALKVEQALHSLVFWVAKWRDTNHLPYLPAADAPDWAIAAELPTGIAWETGALDIIWRLWLAGKIPSTIGEHMVHITTGPNSAAMCTVDVSAHGTCLPGHMKSATLSQAASGKVERRFTEHELEVRLGAIELDHYADQSAIDSAVPDGAIRLNLRAPRIIGRQPMRQQSVFQALRAHPESSF